MVYNIGEMGTDFSPKMPVKSLTSQQNVRIHQLFRQAKFDDPSGEASFSIQCVCSSCSSHHTSILLMLLYISLSSS